MAKFIDKIIFDAEVSERKILLIPVDTIVATPYNPPSRTKAGAKLRYMTESVRKYGAIIPLIITTDRDLVDGNRRLAAAKLAGKRVIECIVLPPEVDKDEVFREVNTTAEKIGGKGWLEACRGGYKKAPAEVMRQHQELFSLIGTYGVDKLIDQRLGLNILALCKSIKALGLVMRLDEIIMRVAQNKLTNKINAELRADKPTSERVASINALLSKAA